MRDRRMMAFEQALTAGDRSHNDVSPERLRLLGKQASARYSQGDTALTDAVVDVLRNQQGLGPEHVRRVTEFANLYAFDDAFSKTAGDHRVVNFNSGPANPSEVMKELRLDPTPITSGPAYSQPIGYSAGQDGLEAMFTGHQKTASSVQSQEYSYVNPHGHIVELWEKLTAAREKIASDLSMFENSYNSAADSMCKEARQVLLDGFSPVDISSVVAAAAQNKSLVKLALKFIYERGVHDVMSSGTAKTASKGLVNTEHPLFKATRDFVKVAEARYNHVAALEQLNDQIRVVRKQLRGIIQ